MGISSQDAGKFWITTRANLLNFKGHVSKMVIWQKEVMDVVSKNLPNSFRNEFGQGGMKILGMEQLGPNNMSPVFLLLYEPKTNFPLETLKEAFLRTNLSYSGK